MNYRSMILMVALGLTACGQGAATGEKVDNSAKKPERSLSWDEFLAQIIKEPDSDVYLTNGDEVIVGEKNLREYYEQFIATNADQTASLEQPLIINRVSGNDDKWNSTVRHNLTYCINKSAFGSRYSTVISAMASATAAWSSVCDVQWQHVSEQDSNCTSSNSSVVFDVNPINVNGQYLARSFFPSSSRSARNVRIDNSAFSTSGSPTLTAVLRHEIGHTLGFRHEHTRPEAGTCFEDNSWRELTSYDRSSVMHYPQCNGISSWALEITSTDKQGCVAVYGSPSGNTCTPNCSGKECGSDGCGGTCGSCGNSESCNTSGQCISGNSGSTSTTETVTGSVAASGTVYYGPYSVVPGTTFDVDMTGTGDPDLYVRFGSKPTTSSYACRPYQDGASESCSLDVPSSATTAYIMIRGYDSATFKLSIKYTKSGSSSSSSSNSSGTIKTDSKDGTVESGSSGSYGPYSVQGGSAFKVAMSGSGDPDLYVRFGSAPTSSTYDCRPYLQGASETCSLTVPSSASSAYLMVRGYSSASYHLDISYTAP